MPSLRTWNGTLAIVHLVAAVGTGIWFIWQNSRGNQDQFDTDLYEHEIDTNGEVKSLKASTGNKTLVQGLLVGFLGITAAFHWYYWRDKNGAYSKSVKNENNSARWIEYAITATIMIVILGILSGVKSQSLIAAMIISAVIIMLQGDLVEKSLKRGNFEWFIPTFVGWLALTFVSYQIITKFWRRLGDAKRAGVEVPKWLYWMIFILIAFYSSFGVWQALQINDKFRGKTYSYKKYEKGYMSLSAGAKLVLALFLAYGFASRSNS